MGIEINTKNTDEKSLLGQLTHDVGSPKLAWKSDDGRYLILEVKLENYRKLIESIASMHHAESITSSGKIRLVKLRISQFLNPTKSD